LPAGQGWGIVEIEEHQVGREWAIDEEARAEEQGSLMGRGQ